MMSRGSFTKIFERERKLTVKKWEGGITSLVPTLFISSKGGGGIILSGKGE